MTKLSMTVTILTKNNEETLGPVLESTKDFNEVVILDTGSTDTTLDLARTYPNVKIFHSPFIGFGSLHNLAVSHASNHWILSLDSDEVLTPKLTEEILTLKLDPKKVYSFPRDNYFNGKHIKWCGWYPDRNVRIYNKNATSFTDDKVHEKVRKKGLSEVKLKGSIRHYSYRSISDFLQKMESYSTLFAKQNANRKKSSLTKALMHGGFAFIKAYIIKRGFLGGKEGFIISLYNGHTAFYKYLKLMFSDQNF